VSQDNYIAADSEFPLALSASARAVPPSARAPWGAWLGNTPVHRAGRPFFRAYAVFVERAETYLRLLAEREIRDRTSLDRLRRAAATLVVAGAVDDAIADGIVDGAEMGRVVRSGNAHFPVHMPQHRPRSAPDDGEWRVIPVGETMIARTGAIVVSAVLRTGHGVFLAALGRGGEQIPLADLVALSASDDKGNLYAFSRDCPAALELSPTPPPDAAWLVIKDDGTERRTVDLSATAPPLPTEPAGGSAADRLLIRRAEATLAAAARGTGFVADTRLGESVEILRDAGLLAADSPLPGQLAALSRYLGVPDAALPTPTELPEPWHDLLTRITRRQRQAAPEVGPITPLAVPLPDLDGLRVLLTGLGGSRLHMIVQDLAMAERGVRTHVGRSGGTFASIPVPDPPMSIWARDADDHYHLAGASEMWVRGSGLTSAEVTLFPPLPPGDAPVALTITAGDSTATVTIPARPR
jgi:hypothetical protein